MKTLCRLVGHDLYSLTYWPKPIRLACRRCPEVVEMPPMYPLRSKRPA